MAQSEGASIGTFTFNGLRTVLGGIVLLPLVAFRFNKENSKLPVKEKQKFPLKDVVIGGICCGIPLFIGGNLQQEAFKYLYVGKVGFITALYMLLVPVFGLFLKQKQRLFVWLAVLIGCFGAYLLCVDGEITTASQTTFEIVPSAFNFVIPCKVNAKTAANI